MTHILTFDETDVVLKHVGTKLEIICSNEESSLPEWQSIDEYGDELLSVLDAEVLLSKDLDNVIRIIRSAGDGEAAAKKLMEQYHISQQQAVGFLSLGLSEMTSFKESDYEEKRLAIEEKRTLMKAL